MADLRTKKKQHQQAEESKSDLELIDEDDLEVVPEVVPAAQEVSTSNIFERDTHQHLG